MGSSELDKEVADTDELRSSMVKAVVVGGQVRETAPSNVMRAVDESERRFGQAGAVDPPYNPVTLAGLLEHSNTLRQNVDAYATNIDGFGHRFEPVIDLDAADADQRIAQAIVTEKQRRLADPDAPATIELTEAPSEAEVKARKRVMVEQMRAEKTRLDQFFEFCCDDMSFVSLRRKLRQDLEVTGNAFAEVIRDGAGDVAEFMYVPAFTVRLLPLDSERTKYRHRVRVSDIAFATVDKHRAFRKLVQIYEQRSVYFKEFGDPRVMSAKSGRVFKTIEELKAADETDSPATEMMHFKIHSPRSAYGVPRWIGNLLSVLGSRQAEEVNFLYFENKSIPPMAVLVSGGRLTQEAVTRLESYVETEIKGKRNFHKILILEAESANSNPMGLENTGKMTIELKPLTDAQMKDALFQNYDERNMDKVGMSFRLPRLLRGDVRDFNRATADAALDFAEQQVFQPEREEFDFIVNRKILADLKIRYWRFKSNAPTAKDPEQLSSIVSQLMTAGALTPEEARDIAGDIFNKDLPPINAAWTKQPIALTIAGIATDEHGRLMPFIGQNTEVAEHDAAYGDADGDGALDPNMAAARRAGAAGLLRLTATATGQAITVNEARAANGLGALTFPDGSANPDGYMSVQEYADRKKLAVQQPGGFAPGAPPTRPPSFKDMAGGAAPGGDGGLSTPSTAMAATSSRDMNVDDLNHGGKLVAAQGALRRMRARRSNTQSVAEAANATAKSLLQIRNALLEAEALEAQTNFLTRKREADALELVDEECAAEIEKQMPAQVLTDAELTAAIEDAAAKPKA